MPRLWFVLSALLLAAPDLLLAAAAPSLKLQFNRDIRPIPSDKCFHSHGPNKQNQKADLRLDLREAATAKGHITPGQPEKSQILERILSDDPDEVMPPPESKLGKLSAKDAETLRQWIAQGAEYEAHWSFVPLDLGRLKGLSIDGIVSEGLSARGLKLQPQADAATLLRRLSFDLTGLPPSPAEISQFETQFARDADATVKAWINQLLARPQYGERMAVDWLDVARYADSYGFQVDREREVWPWRDWVVKAFNDNLPIDKFITWQLAGDMLPKPTQEQRLATAFNRLHQQESEGGSVEEEYRVEYVADRVQTVATAFLGLTLECARCHDHKYDPISQREYYGLFSMFQNVDEAGLYSFFTPSAPTPALFLSDEATRSKLAQLQAGVDSRQRAAMPLPQITLPRDALAIYDFNQAQKNRFPDLLHPQDPKANAQLKGANRLVPGRDGQAIAFTGDDAVDTPVGNFKRHEAFSVALVLQATQEAQRAVVLHRSRAWTDAASRGYELLIEDGRLKWSLIHFWPGNAISIRAIDPLPLNRWQEVVATYDGSSRADGLHLYLNGSLLRTEIVRDHLTRTIQGGGGDNITLGERFRDRGFKGGLIDELRVYQRDLSTTAAPDAALVEARRQLFELQDAQKEIMVMQEMATPKPAFILTRGEYDKRAAAVSATVPAVLGPLPSGSKPDRLGFARWLTSPRHPLTSRVMVNRLWNSLFGRGLVRSTEDLGSQGEKPLYPDLLDHLAAKLILSGWDMKALLREILQSRVYRQRSLGDASVMADDPENQWLARGPRLRLSAEMIRDNALAASGLLRLDMGGPPVNPPEMTEAFKPVTPSGNGGALRRSLYTRWQRTSPPPAMLAFDAPRRAVCTSRRERSDSPLQALILLNGTQYVEAARALGCELLRKHKACNEALIGEGFLRTQGRRPDAREVEICLQQYAAQLRHFSQRPSEAQALLKVGQIPAPADLPPDQAAAATMLAQLLLNHDACVVKR